MARRTKRMKQPWQPERHLQELGKARASLCQMQGEIVINSDLYRAARKCIEAIDDVAEQLTGDRSHFTPVQRY